MKRFAVIGIVVLAAGGVAAYVYRERPAPKASVGLPAMQTAFANANDKSERSHALRRAATLDDPGVARWLTAIVESDATLANQASSALGAMSSKAAAGELDAIAMSTESTLVRANAVRALGKCGGPREVSTLSTLLGDRIQPQRVRQEAAFALGAIGDLSAVPALIAAIESTNDATPENEQLRISAVQALGALKSPAAREFLTRYAQRTLSTTERSFVARAAK